MGVGGRPKEYTRESLRRAVDRYFKSITRSVKLTEPVDTGKKDKYGHAIIEQRPVLNRLGKQVEVIQYVVPPSKGDLATALGIHRSTWDNYHDKEKYPEFADIVAEADGMIQTWNEKELLTRDGKNVKGIIFNLENNYGYRERIDTRHTGIGEFLAELDSQGTEGSL